MRVVYLACSSVCLYFLALVLPLAAYEQSTPERAQTLDAARAAFGAAIRNPWIAPLHTAGQTSPPDNSALKDRTSPGKLFTSLDGPHPQAHRMTHDAWFHFHPTSPEDISQMLDDPAPMVQSDARLLWNIALSGGREADAH